MLLLLILLLLNMFPSHDLGGPIKRVPIGTRLGVYLPRHMFGAIVALCVENFYVITL